MNHPSFSRSALMGCCILLSVAGCERGPDLPTLELHFDGVSACVDAVHATLTPAPGTVDEPGTLSATRGEDGAWMARFAPIGRGHYRIDIDARQGIETVQRGPARAFLRVALGDNHHRVTLAPYTRDCSAVEDACHASVLDESSCACTRITRAVPRCWQVRDFHPTTAPVLRLRRSETQP